MMVLEELQFELGGVVFGHDTDIPIHVVEGLGRPERRERRTPVPGQDSVWFGREYAEPRVITFEGNVVHAGEPAAVWDRASALDDAFGGDEVHHTSLAVVPLRLRRPGGLTKVVYGRPERFDPDFSQQAIGLVPWTGTFVTESPLFYGEEEQRVVSAGGSVSEGHIILTEDSELVAPLVTTASSGSRHAVTNLGRLPAWPVIEVAGPIDRPSIELVDERGGLLWRLAYGGSVAHDEVVTIDTRSWSRGVRLNGRHNVGASLSTDSWLSRSTIPPGTHEVRVLGTDPTGTSRFTIRWQPAYRNL